MHNRLLDLEEQLKQATPVHAPQRMVKNLRRPASLPTYPWQPAEKISKEKGLRGRVRAMSGPVSYTIPGVIGPVAQDKSMACWAAATTMLIGWHEQASMSIHTGLSRIGPEWVKIYDDNIGLTTAHKPTFATAAGLEFEAPMSYSVEGWEQLLRRYGPLWVTTASPSFAIHGRVIKGISGDGTPDGTKIFLLDPDGGREYSQSVTEFSASFAREAAETNNPLRLQVIHWPAQVNARDISRETSFMSAERTGISLMQQAATSPAAEDDKDLKELKDKVKGLVEKKFGGDYKKAFDSYDANKDGAINAEELGKLLKDAEVGNFVTRNDWVKAIIEKLDNNKDGKIQWSEFESAIKQ